MGFFPRLSLLAFVAFALSVYAGLTPIRTRDGNGGQQVWLPGQKQQIAYGTPRTETSYKSYSPDTFVEASIVSVFIPLPASAGTHPPECDYLSYIRYRHVDGPKSSLEADRVISFIPGTIAGAGSFDQVARSSIFYADENHQQKIEVWALDRRANCLEDNTGAVAAVEQQDAQLGFDYYYNKKEINGRSFAGFRQNGDADLEFLAEQGVEQTIEDWYDLVLKELPDQGFRTKNHYISGHSLGGPLAASFSNFDKDGNANTTADAGYNQHAGTIGYDTVVDPHFGPELPDAFKAFDFILKPIVEGGFDLAQAGFKSGVLPRSLLTALPIVLNSEATTFLQLVGAAAQIKPKEEAPIKTFPRTPTIVSAAQFFFSQYLTNFITFTPSAFNLRATNEALLGAILSDRTQGFGFLQVSCGFGAGGAIQERQFPVGYNDLQDLDTSNMSAIKPLLEALPSGSPYPLAVPTDAGPLGLGDGPLYTWLNYNEISADGGNVAKANNGKPFMNASNEVTDIAELARSISEIPLDFTEHYYATKITTDYLFAAFGSDQALGRTTVHPNGFKARPIINLVGSEGLAIGGGFGDLGNHVVLDGYNHLDVIQAARNQTLGRKELSSISTADFVSKLGQGVLP